MKFKKAFLIICLIVCLFCVSGVCAGDAADNLTANDLNDDAVASDLDSQVVAFDDNLDDDELSANATDVLSSDMTKEVVSESPKTFTDLNDDVKNVTDNKIYLKGNYKFDSDKDSSFKDGVRITASGVTVYGKGHKIDANNLARIFIVKNCVFRDVIFVNANTTKSGGAVNGNNVTFINCKFVNNYAGTGGAIYATGTCTVSKCTFNFNSAKYYGGAIYSIGSATSRQSKFTGNYANVGGAVYTKDKCVATGSSFTRNSAKRGSGGAINSQSLNIAKSSLFSNSATKDGGAIMVYSGLSKVSNSFFKYNSAKCTGGSVWATNGHIVRSGFTSNKGRDGGAVVLLSGSIYYSRFVTNSAKSVAGAVSVLFPSKIVGSVFIKNRAGQVAGALNAGDDTPSGASLVSGCKFLSNSAKGVGAAFVHGRVVSCTFKYNTAKIDCGALHGGDAVKCTFIKNTAFKGRGGAMYDGSAIGCIFKSNKANEGITTFNTKLSVYPANLSIDRYDNNVVVTLKDNRGNPVKGYKLELALYHIDHNDEDPIVEYLTTDNKGEAVFSPDFDLDDYTDYVTTVTWKVNNAYTLKATTNPVLYSKKYGVFIP